MVIKTRTTNVQERYFLVSCGGFRKFIVFRDNWIRYCRFILFSLVCWV